MPEATFQPANHTVQYQTRDGVALLTLANADPKQSLTAAVHADLKACWLEINADDAVNVAVITGAGGIFATGLGFAADVQAAYEGSETPATDWIGTFQNRRYAESLPEWGGWKSLFGLPNRAEGEPAKPLIVAVNGVCSGEGLRLLENCDFAIAADDSTFFDPHVNAALAATDEAFGMVRFRNLPRADAMRLALMGRRYTLDATRALRLGLVTEVVPAAVLMERAFELAKVIAGFPPLAVRATCAAVWDTWTLPYNEARYWSESFGNQVRQSPEARDAIVAAARRRPAWTGK